MRRQAWLAALVLAGCRAPSAPTPTLSCAERVEDVTDWAAVDRSSFRFRLPAEFVEVPVQGIDSRVGRWTAGPLRDVTFDEGMFAGPVDGMEDHPGYAECRDFIDGRAVTIVVLFDSAGTFSVGRGKKYWAAASWRDVMPEVHLTMTATTPDAADVPELVAILRSVRFPDGLPTEPLRQP